VRFLSTRRLWKGLDASFRSAVGATSGLIMLLGLDDIHNYPSFIASLIATGIVSYTLLEPLSHRISGVESDHAADGIDRRQRFRLLVRLTGVAALAVAAHELFVKGIDRMESGTLDEFSFQQLVAYGPFIIPILIGIFLLCTLVTLCWTLGDGETRGSHKHGIAFLSGSTGATLAIAYFYLRSGSSDNIFSYLSWPPAATFPFVLAHVFLAGALGFVGGFIVTRTDSTLRRPVVITASLSLVTVIWIFVVYYYFELIYEGLVDLNVFRCHMFVVIGWAVGLFAGPLGRESSPHHSSISEAL